MSQSALEPTPVTFNIIMADASNLPIHHVNALAIRSGSDEFFLTLGVVQPPDQSEVAALVEAGHIEAQPVFRFAISRDTMEKFLAVMAGQYDEQTRAIKQLRSLMQKATKEEVSGNE
jgi:hypothetical protein